MTKSKAKANKDADYNDRVQQAADWVQSGIYKSSYDAAEQLNVRATTVQYRMKGRKSRVESHEDEQALFPVEEAELVR